MRFVGGGVEYAERPQREGTEMEFQAYLDNVQRMTGKTPNDFIAEARAKGLSSSRDVVAWLKAGYGLGTGYARAVDYVIQHGASFTVHRQAGEPRVETGTLILDGSSLAVGTAADD